jgi:hypothetical protein
MLRATAERASIRLLADEADRAWMEVAREAFEPFRAPCEVASTEVGRSSCRAPRGVRDPDVERGKLILPLG